MTSTFGGSLSDVSPLGVSPLGLFSLKTTPSRKNLQKISIILHDTLDRIEIPDKIKINLPKIDTTIPCDSEKLEIVFVNLLMNAIQAIGDKKGEVYINIADEPGDITLIYLSIEVMKFVSFSFSPIFEICSHSVFFESLIKNVAPFPL